MKHLVIKILAVSLCLVSYAANAQSKKKVKTVQDKEGNTYEYKLMPGKLNWITSNLKVTIPDSYIYFNADSNIAKYGKLYTWQAAREGCQQLGEGWRLPTDAEWQKMAEDYGGIAENSKDTGRAAYTALMFTGKSGFNAVWGGRRDEGKQYWQAKFAGFYWTATETDSSHAVTYIFHKKEQKLAREGSAFDKQWSLSVRCVKGK